MVGAGIGVTLIPQMAVSVETRSAPVAVSSFKAPQPSRQIGLVWRKSDPRARQFEALSDVVRKALEAMPHLEPIA
jgi:LysR family hydrogen peroxide-inducible transcriptional activator